MKKRDFKITERQFIEDINWEDDFFGVAEDTIEYVTSSNHTLHITYKLSIEVDWDRTRREILEVEEIYVESPFGHEVELTDEEYEQIEQNFKEVTEW